MLFKLKSKLQKKLDDMQTYSEWRDWFAWFPTRVDEYNIAWLHTIEKRRVYKNRVSFEYYHIYREKNE